jgi:antitoxin VapB
MGQVAKIFRNGRSQAVRLPAAFRFEATEVFVRRDPSTGDVILSEHPTDWEDLWRAVTEAKGEAAGFLADRDDSLPQARNLF